MPLPGDVVLSWLPVMSVFVHIPSNLHRTPSVSLLSENLLSVTSLLWKGDQKGPVPVSFLLL